MQSNHSTAIFAIGFANYLILNKNISCKVYISTRQRTIIGSNGKIPTIFWTRKKNYGIRNTLILVVKRKNLLIKKQNKFSYVSVNCIVTHITL